MKRAGLVIVVFVALVALALGFGASTATLYITQPSSNSTATVHFVVNPGDSAAAVADNLQKAGLIRNAQLFRVWARYRHLDSGIEPGVYDLQANLTMDKILATLQNGKPDERLAGVPDGKRVTEYPAYLAKDLPKFNSDNFLAMAKSGIEPDKTKLWEKYWYVQQPKTGSGVVYALEGYLYPEHYFFQPEADETVVVERMIEQLGVLLCPGPDDKPTAYINDKAQCIAHGATIGDKKVNIFKAMEDSYFTKDPVQALHDTLIIASMTAREIAKYSDAPGVANSYWTRYAALSHHIDNTGDVADMGSDPTVQYARDTDHPPAQGQKWWTDLNNAGKLIDTTSPYNVYTNGGKLPPGPIANPHVEHILAAANPSKTPYFYFVSDHCGNIHYAKTGGAEFDAIVQKYITQNQCSTSIN
ncbi:MAG: endolytic transglycosylase MltG [Ktedonobacterales bacterium]